MRLSPSCAGIAPLGTMTAAPGMFGFSQVQSQPTQLQQPAQQQQQPTSQPRVPSTPFGTSVGAKGFAFGSTAPGSSTTSGSNMAPMISTGIFGNSFQLPNFGSNTSTGQFGFGSAPIRSFGSAEGSSVGSGPFGFGSGPGGGGFSFGKVPMSNPMFDSSTGAGPVFDAGIRNAEDRGVNPAGMIASGLAQSSQQHSPPMSVHRTLQPPPFVTQDTQTTNIQAENTFPGSANAQTTTHAYYAPSSKQTNFGVFLGLSKGGTANFGFIKPEDGDGHNVFVHMSNLEEGLAAGHSVVYDLAPHEQVRACVHACSCVRFSAVWRVLLLMSRCFSCAHVRACVRACFFRGSTVFVLC